MNDPIDVNGEPTNELYLATHAQTIFSLHEPTEPLKVCKQVDWYLNEFT